MRENSYEYNVPRVKETEPNGEKANPPEGNKKGSVKQAIALEYNPAEDAPRVVASGRGYLAERIIERAKEAQVPVHQDTKLANTLSKLEIGEMIPPQLYEVVAEILVFVDAMDKIKSKGFQSGK